jgi:hypothetical protein
MFSLNHIFIRGSQLLDECRRARYGRNETVFAPEKPIRNIRTFCSAEVTGKHALLSLIPSSWVRAVATAPNIRIFNIDGLSYEVVKALNKKGYIVDIADYRDTAFRPERHYDFYLGHGGYCKSTLASLSQETLVLNYASGACWHEFNRMSQERYNNFRQRKGLDSCQGFTRSFQGTEQGEKFLVERADSVFIAGPRTAGTYKTLSRNIERLYLGAYVETDYFIEDRDFEAGRRNFVYVAGSGGNIQKGMDLIVEAFSRMPDLNLYIYCKVEREVSEAYRRELSLPNIRYVYHYSKGPLRRRMRNLLRRINFTIGAPIDTGVGTAMLGSMGIGLIPVGYIDIEAEESNSVLTNSFDIEAIMAAARRASEKSAKWCREASRQTLERFQRLHEPSQFGKNFKAYLDRLGL